SVAAAAEQLAPEVPLAERPEMQQCFQRAELAERQADRAHDRLQPCRHRVGRPHELDVRVERGHLFRLPPIVGGHSLNLNRYYRPRPTLSSRAAAAGARGGGPIGWRRRWLDKKKRHSCSQPAPMNTSGAQTLA